MCENYKWLFGVSDIKCTLKLFTTTYFNKNRIHYDCKTIPIGILRFISIS